MDNDIKNFSNIQRLSILMISDRNWTRFLEQNGKNPGLLVKGAGQGLAGCTYVL